MCRLPIEGRMTVNSTIFFHDLKASFHKLIFCCVKMGKREENSKSELLWKVCLCWTFLLIGSRKVFVKGRRKCPENVIKNKLCTLKLKVVSKSPGRPLEEKFRNSIGFLEFDFKFRTFRHMKCRLLNIDQDCGVVSMQLNLSIMGMKVNFYFICFSRFGNPHFDFQKSVIVFSK